MARTHSQFRWTWKFALRLLASYVVIPLVPGGLLALSTRGSAGDLLGIVYIYAIFGFGAMAVLGTPLLLVYLRLGWTGFLPFIAAGGVCAGITAYIIRRASQGLGMVSFFTVSGLIAGLLFRAMLFGFRQQPASERRLEEGA